MNDEITAFDLGMQAGVAARDAGDFESAIDSFGAAFRLGLRRWDDNMTSQALQARGITHRLAGEFGKAYKDLADALELCQSRTIREATVRRDFAALLMVMAEAEPSDSEERIQLFDQAQSQLGVSLQDLERLAHFDSEWGDIQIDGELTEETIRARLEYYTSRGFLGRLRAKQGRRKEALALLREAHQGLCRKHDTYELNNMTFMVKEFKLMLPIYGLRMIKLIIATGQTRRFKQMLGIR